MFNLIREKYIAHYRFLITIIEVPNKSNKQRHYIQVWAMETNKTGRLYAPNVSGYKPPYNGRYTVETLNPDHVVEHFWSELERIAKKELIEQGKLINLSKR